MAADVLPGAPVRPAETMPHPKRSASTSRRSRRSWLRAGILRAARCVGGWPTISPPIRTDYARFVELSNNGARVLGSTTPVRRGGANTTCRWTPLRKNWTGSGNSFSNCSSLHTYVRAKPRDDYGAVVPEIGPILKPLRCCLGDFLVAAQSLRLRSCDETSRTQRPRRADLPERASASPNASPHRRIPPRTHSPNIR